MALINADNSRGNLFIVLVYSIIKIQRLSYHIIVRHIKSNNLYIVNDCNLYVYVINMQSSCHFNNTDKILRFYYMLNNILLGIVHINIIIMYLKLRSVDVASAEIIYATLHYACRDICIVNRTQAYNLGKYTPLLITEYPCHSRLIIKSNIFTLLRSKKIEILNILFRNIKNNG